MVASSVSMSGRQAWFGERLIVESWVVPDDI